jgi:hypothetical protein
MDVQAAIGAAERLGVSEVARGANGFVRAYQRFGGRASSVENAIDINTGQLWGVRRRAFIERHLAQYDQPGGSTLRRRIALLMWAYDARGPRRKVDV